MNGRPTQPPVLFYRERAFLPFPIQLIEMLRRYWAEEVAADGRVVVEL
jgi:hypothetical protein